MIVYDGDDLTTKFGVSLPFNIGWMLTSQDVTDGFVLLVALDDIRGGTMFVVREIKNKIKKTNRLQKK